MTLLIVMHGRERVKAFQIKPGLPVPLKTAKEPSRPLKDIQGFSRPLKIAQGT